MFPTAGPSRPFSTCRLNSFNVRKSASGNRLGFDWRPPKPHTSKYHRRCALFSERRLAVGQLSIRVLGSQSVTGRGLRRTRDAPNSVYDRAAPCQCDEGATDAAQESKYSRRLLCSPLRHWSDDSFVFRRSQGVGVRRVAASSWRRCCGRGSGHPAVWRTARSPRGGDGQ